MVQSTHSPVSDLRGASQLVIDATRGVTSLVEAMHVAIAGGPALLGQPLRMPAAAAVGPVYSIIRGVTQLVGGSIDLALAPLAALGKPRVSSAERERFLAVLNGVLGDHLSERGNPLAIAMTLRHDGTELTPATVRTAIAGAGAKLAVLVHGLCMTDRQWTRDGHDHGAALARDLGYTPVYVHYNSGRHISTNGRDLADQLEQLTAAWPAPLDELVIVGHSMGGLVARSAIAAGERAGHAWRSRVRAVITLGTPHHGAPLERGGHRIDRLWEISRYIAPFGRLGRIRSAGITDLRFGNVLDEHWEAADRFEQHHDHRCALALPAAVACYAIAGTFATATADRLPGDGLVPVDSALGVHDRPELTLGFPDDHRWIALGIGHFELLGAPEVYARIRSWLAPSC